MCVSCFALRTGAEPKIVSLDVSDYAHEQLRNMHEYRQTCISIPPPHNRATEFCIKLGVPIRATGMMALLGAARWLAAEPANDSAWSRRMTPHGAGK